ncbi:MAG: nucleotidyltransferase family protein, partial [Mesorhizobium sp.]
HRGLHAARRKFVRVSLKELLLPGPERAFPAGWHDRLIKAAIHADDAQAFAHADAWLLANDIDHASLRDHRLLAEVAARFGPRLVGHAAYPRLVGLRRMLWTRSEMMLREAKPALSAIAGAGVQMLLLKGAARLAQASPEAENGRAERIVRDIDMAVRPKQLPTAYDSLIEHGWRPAQGVSHHYVREHLASMRGVGMIKGNLGDIELHPRLFHPGQGEAQDDAALWQRSHPVQLDNVEARLPSPEDGLALAIAHGGLNGHADSDWLVDAAGILSRHTLDWNRFAAIVEARSLQAPALFALAYLSAQAGLPVPAPVLANISQAARAKPLAYLSASAQARPRESATVIGNSIRGVAKLLRKRAARRQARRAGDRWLTVRKVAQADTGAQSVPDLEQHVAVPPRLRGDRAHFHAVVQIAAPPGRRRIEFEVNAADRHICRIRYRKWSNGARLLTLAIDGPIDIAPGETGLTLVSRPSRLLRHAGPREKARYDALAFRCIVLEITENRDGRR